jgi:hypothetical protein
MNGARRLLAGALAVAALLPFAAAASPAGYGGGRGGGGGSGPAINLLGDEDSPWPDTGATRPNVRAIRAVVRDLEAKVEQMELSVARYADWEACLHGVPVSEYGDPDRQFGYDYDERDGTGASFMPALAVDRTSRPRREDYLFLDFSRAPSCRSNSPRPGGTAEAASVRPAAPPAGAASPLPARPPRAGTAARYGPDHQRALPRTLGGLERRVRTLKRSSRRLLTASERFDEWESCVSWVPVTEYGDPDGGFGYLFGSAQPAVPEYRPALSIDRSDWDDPDYMFLALVGGDRPGRTCQDEPGEAID